MHYKQIGVVVLLLSFAALCAHSQTTETEKELQTFLSTKFHSFLNPGDYEEKFKRAVHVHDSYRYQRPDTDQSSVLFKASGDDPTDPPKPGDFQVALRYLQDVLYSSSAAPDLAKIAREVSRDQQVSDFETCSNDVNAMIDAFSNETNWAIRSEYSFSTINIQLWVSLFQISKNSNSCLVLMTM